MITYKIISNTGKKLNHEIRPVKPTDKDYKDVVYERALSRCFYREGSKVKIRRSSRRGVVQEVIKDKERVNWVNNSPYFIVVKFQDGVIEQCSPSQLKNSKL
jgi:hypothetical protein